jgi:hypothetical protein
MMSRKFNTTSKSKSTGSSESKAVTNINSASTRQAQSALNEADLQGMIATAAYYRAERRGFNCGDETQDWLEAEAEINNLLQNSKSGSELLKKM